MKNKKASEKTSETKGRFLCNWKALSARSRILIYFLLFTVFMLLMSWLFQIVFFDDFYQAQTYYSLKRISSTLSRNLGNESLSALVERIAEDNNLCVIVADEKMNVLAEAEGLHLCLLHHMSRHEFGRYIFASNTHDEIQYFSYPMMAFRNNRYDARKFVGPVPRQDDSNLFSLISVQKVSIGEGRNVYIFLNAIMTPLNGTVSTIRNELTFITIFLILFSLLISWLLSRRITRPIVEITEASAFLKERKYLPVAHADYREVQELDQRLLETADELQKVDGMQKELIANISHDLRTPLTLIQGYAEMIRDIPSEGTPENMQILVDEAKRLSTLVEDVLALNHLQKKQATPEIESLLPSECIQAMADRYNKLLEKQGYQVLYQFSEDELITVNRKSFEQVLQNLVNNAITYSGKDKTVIIRQSVVNEGHMRFEIIDKGEGIAEEDLPFIWERYYRGSHSHKRPTIGSGLGLNIVQNILKASGQAYGVKSKLGEGSNFWFEVPLAKEH